MFLFQPEKADPKYKFMEQGTGTDLRYCIVDLPRNFNTDNRRFRRGITLLMLFCLMGFVTTCWTLNKLTSQQVDRKYSSVQRTYASNSKAQTASVLHIKEIRIMIRQYNQMQTVLNEDRYGPLKKDAIVIVVQVHNRWMYLRHTINSFARVKGIENALLVFSHDYYDESINDLVQKIDFCKVIQIFYPYSIQTHPNEFPGDSPDDCPSDIDRRGAEELNCTNALHPDLHGHYREAKLVQMKHHWWWKANHVFNELNVTKNFTGLFAFFEDDYYAAPDFIHMALLMETVRQSQCPQCRILSMGSHTEGPDFASDSRKAEIIPWDSNMGMVFNRSVWQELKSCANTFCTFDDYNWDWTLLAVVQKCMLHGLPSMQLRAPRVFHMGECGVHHHGSCNSTKILRQIQEILAKVSVHLYPQKLLLTSKQTEPYQKNSVTNGGWGDVRDHALCLKIVGVSK